MMSIIGSLIFAFTISTQPLQEVKMLEKNSSEQIIYLVRHGQSEGNVVDPKTGYHRISGMNSEYSLTEKGKQQASSLGEMLAKKIPEKTQVVICSSTTLRAEQTAQQMFERLETQYETSFGGKYDGLVEIGMGTWEGQPKDENYYAMLKKWESLPAREKWSVPRMEGGESYKDVAERALPEIQKIADQHPDSMIFVVSHNNTMNAIALQLNHDPSAFSEAPDSKLPTNVYQNCDVLVLKIPKGKKVAEATATEHYSSGV